MLLCQRCNKAHAAVHVLDIVPPHGEKRERHLCERCAAEEGVTAQKHEPITSILDTFINKHAAGAQQLADFQCPDCGMTFREFRSQGLLGCSNDYSVFEKPLASLIERAHDGASKHVGKTPGRLKGEIPAPSREAVLRRQMREAVELEDYELAARLRDQLKDLEAS